MKKLILLISLVGFLFCQYNIPHFKELYIDSTYFRVSGDTLIIDSRPVKLDSLYISVTILKKEDVDRIVNVTNGTKANSKALVVNSSGYIDKVKAVELQMTDTDYSNELALYWNENESNDKTITLLVNGASRVVSLSDSLTVISGGTLQFDNDSWFQSYNSDSSVKVNVFKIDTDSKLQFGVDPVLSFPITAPAQSGDNWTTLFHALTDTSQADGDTLGFKIMAGGEVVGSIGALADGTGGVDNPYFILPETGKLYFDDGSEYIRSNGANKLQFAVNDNREIYISTSSIYGLSTGNFLIKHSQGQSSTIPIYTFVNDTTSGINAPGDSVLSIIAGSKECIRVDGTGTNAFVIYSETVSGITASTTQTQGQQPLTTNINEISVVANVNDVVTMPSAVAGLVVRIVNNGANTLQIFPASDDNLGAGVNTSVTLAAGSNVTYWAYDGTNWETD